MRLHRFFARHPLRKLVAWGTWSALSTSGLLLVWAWNLKHPILLVLRPIETPLLLMLGLIGACFHGVRCRGARGQRLAHGLGLALAATACLVTITGEWRYQSQKRQVLQASAATQMLGGHFIVGFTDWHQLEPLASRGLIGGIYITKRNVAGLSVARVAERIAHLQSLRASAHLDPLIVCADQEGGKVSRLSPLIPAMPALSSVASLGPEAYRASVDYGKQQGRALAALGINLNLAPVADLKPAKGIPVGDLNTQIAQRAIAPDAETVTLVARAYSLGLRDSHVQATLKHFPGLGRVQADTHEFKAELDLPAAELATEWAPFRDASLNTDAAIMLSHVTLPRLDAANPVSHSRRVIQGVIRNTWGFQGLLLTDDLNMGAVYGEGIGHAASAALNAGADLVLVTYDPDQYFRALAETTKAWHQGRIDPRMLRASQQRLEARWKLFPGPTNGSPNTSGRASL